MNGKLNGIIRPVLDENNNLVNSAPEFHFYISMPKEIVIGHNMHTEDDKVISVYLATIYQNSHSEEDIMKDTVYRFRHRNSRTSPHIVPPWFNIKTYHGDVRRENFSKGIFVTNLEQNKQ